MNLNYIESKKMKNQGTPPPISYEPDASDEKNYRQFGVSKSGDKTPSSKKDSDMIFLYVTIFKTWIPPYFPHQPNLYNQGKEPKKTPPYVRDNK